MEKGYKNIRIANQVLDQKNKQLDVKARSQRKKMIDELANRQLRYQRQIRMGMQPTDDIEKLDNYAEKLIQVVDQDGYPKNIFWPQYDDKQTENSY